MINNIKKNIFSRIKKVFFYIIYYPKYILLKISGESDEIITIIDGGLGSQMSQYAIGQEIQHISGIQVSYDLTWYEKNGKDIYGKENRFFELEKIFPNIKIKKASKEKVNIYKKLFNKQKNGKNIQNLDELIFKSSPATKPIYLGGYWSSQIYTNYNLDNLRKNFTFSLSLDENNNKMLEKIISASCSVAIQIRMGDYIGSTLEVITQNYFKNAIEYIIKNVSITNINFFIFSTDSENAKKMLPLLSNNYTFVNINKNDNGAYDMYLMSHCHHFIISNSTFGFWPALLSNRSDKKIVIQPDKWLNTDTERLSSKYPCWIMMQC